MRRSDIGDQKSVSAEFARRQILRPVDRSDTRDYNRPHAQHLDSKRGENLTVTATNERRAEPSCEAAKGCAAIAWVLTAESKSRVKSANDVPLAWPSSS